MVDFSRRPDVSILCRVGTRLLDNAPQVIDSEKLSSSSDASVSLDPGWLLLSGASTFMSLSVSRGLVQSKKLP